MRRAVRNLIRLIAAGLIIFGVMEIGLELVRHRMRQTEIRLWQCVIGSALILIGGLLAAASSNLAERFTDDDDDDGASNISPPPSAP